MFIFQYNVIHTDPFCQSGAQFTEIFQQNKFSLVVSALPSARPPPLCLSAWKGATSIKGNFVKFHAKEFHENVSIYSNFL